MPLSSTCNWNEQDRAAVRDQLQRIASSDAFKQSERRRQFLRYVVEEALAGRGDRLKGYTIAIEVFGRSSAFDAQLDPIVRIEAGRLRDKLHEYYATAGRSDAIVIDLPKGGYVPSITIRPTPSEPALKQALVAEQSDDQTTRPPQDWQSVRLLSNNALMSVAACLTIIIGCWAIWFSRHDDKALPDRPSIAVMPIENIGADSKWSRFADGLTEDIIADLARYRDLVVIARSSTRRYQGPETDARHVGRALNVKYVLEGSMQAMRDRIRVSAQLIDARSGVQVWTERYDRPVDDLFAVQNELTQNIAASLGSYAGAVARAERQQIRRKPPASLTAYDSYLLAVEAKHKVTRESLAEAEALLGRSIALDPELARAYVALVDTYWYQIDLGFAESIGATAAKMLTAGEKAAALDPSDGRAHYALGLAALYNAKAEVAAAEFRTAEALAPSDADTLLTIAWSLPGLGETDRAVSLAERALILNPHYPDWYNQGLSYVFFFGGQYQRSVHHRLLVKKPLAVDYAYLAAAYALLGKQANASAAAAEVRQRNPGWTAETYLSQAGGYPEMEAEKLIDGARKAGLNACASAASVASDPKFIAVKSCSPRR